MATKITTQAMLEGKVLEKYVATAVKSARNNLYKTIQSYVVEYYKEYTPSAYERTWKFLNSLIKTDVKINGNEIECYVRLDEAYLNYKYPISASYRQAVSGKDVATWANMGLHGGYTEGDVNFWDDALAEYGLSYGFMSDLKTYLQKAGFKIL